MAMLAKGPNVGYAPEKGHKWWVKRSQTPW